MKLPCLGGPFCGEDYEIPEPLELGSRWKIPWPDGTKKEPETRFALYEIVLCPFPMIPDGQEPKFARFTLRFKGAALE